MGVGHEGTYRSRLVALAADGLVVAGCDLGEPPVETGLSLEVVESDAGDVDGDGDADFVSTGVEGWATVVNDGDGSFTVSSHPFTRSGTGTSLVPVDLDGDGDLDVVHGVFDGGVLAWRLEAFLKDGPGRLRPSRSPTATGRTSSTSRSRT